VGRLEFEPLRDDSALALWRRSPHATIFTRPDVLRNFFDAVEWWGAIRRGVPVAAWPVALDATGRPTRSGWFYFVGPIWDGEAFPPAAHRSVSATLAVYTGLVEALVDTYGGFAASLPPPQTDVRAFTWWRYEDGAPIAVQPRYSARIDSLGSRSFSDLLAAMRQVRRYELRRELPIANIEWSAEIGAEELTEVYLERVPSDGADVLSDSQRLLALIEEGSGFTSVARDVNGRVIAVIAALCDDVMANIVVSSVSTDWRSSGVGVHNTVRALAHAQRLGLNRFDFNGANSPSRGDDKHSYGADPVLYFDVSYNNS
jgi:hypothetical protein